MRIKRLAIGVAAALLSAGFVLSSTAEAQNLGRGAGALVRAGKPGRTVAAPGLGRALGRTIASQSGRSARVVAPNIGRTVQRMTASRPQATMPRLSVNRMTASRPHGPSHLSTPYGTGGYNLANVIQSLAQYGGQYAQHNGGYYGGYGNYGRGYGYGYPNVLNGLFGGYPYGGNPYPNGYGHDYYPDKAYADAYRDAAIANAVASVASAAIISSAQPRYVQPAGHYERRQVVVKPGYYEDTQVWVPDYQDPTTGDIVSGHYEVRRRWVPEVYGYQDVWVGPPATVTAPVRTPVPSAYVAPVPVIVGP